jgi:hypothetical protein
VRTGGGVSEAREAFPADTYICMVNQAEMTESQFKDEKSGATKYQIKLTWEVCQLTPEQEEAELEVGKWFFQWLEPYYGETRNGPSKFKAFIDSLQEQGMLATFDPADFDTDDLIGLKQKVTVQEFKRADGTLGNKVTGVLPLKPRKRGAQSAEPQDIPPSRPRPASPPAGITRKSAPVAVKNEPVPVGAEDDDALF